MISDEDGPDTLPASELEGDASRSPVDSSDQGTRGEDGHLPASESDRISDENSQASAHAVGDAVTKLPPG